MCVIIIKNQSNKRLSKSTLLKASIYNPDGLGVVWLDTKEVKYYDSEDYNVLYVNRPFIAHFRKATVGLVSRENCHPFRIGDSPEFLFQNGTVYKLGNKEKTDTEEMADLLSYVDRDAWAKLLSMNSCRWTTVNIQTGKYQIYNKNSWWKRKGIWYSKDNVLTSELVAVYGTLKRNQSNYYHYLLNSPHIGSGTTTAKYPLIVDGLPYLLPQKGIGHHVEVDVFLVDKETFADLDQLEGHPHHYERKQITITLHSGEKLLCWIYFCDKVTDSTDYQKSYTGYSYPGYRSYLRPVAQKTLKSSYKRDYAEEIGYEDLDADLSWKEEELDETHYLGDVDCAYCHCQMHYDEFEDAYWCSYCQEYNYMETYNC